VQTYQVEIKGEACLKFCPVIFERDEDDDSFQITPPPSPSKDTSNDLRRSNRIGSGTKRSYEGRINEIGRLRKQFKYSILFKRCMVYLAQKSPCRGLPARRASNIRCQIKTQWGPSDYPLLSRSWAALERSEGRRPTVSHSVRGESPREVFETNV
jgi:hypothetical protein